MKPFHSENSPAFPASPSAMAATAIFVVLVGMIGIAGWLLNGDTLLWSLMQSGLAWCL